MESIPFESLPYWLIVSAAIIFILKQVGLLDFALSRFADSSEYQQETKAKQTEHLQKSQGDALSSSLDILNRLIDNLIANSNGRMGKMIEGQGQIIGILRKLEGQQTITNRDWSRIEEILGDIDLELHEIKGGMIRGKDAKD